MLFFWHFPCLLTLPKQECFESRCCWSYLPCNRNECNESTRSARKRSSVVLPSSTSLFDKSVINSRRARYQPHPGASNRYQGAAFDYLPFTCTSLVHAVCLHPVPWCSCPSHTHTHGHGITFLGKASSEEIEQNETQRTVHFRGGERYSLLESCWTITYVAGKVDLIADVTVR